MTDAATIAAGTADQEPPRARQAPSDRHDQPRRSVLEVRALRPAAALVFNPHAGQKLGVSTNRGGPEQVHQALRAAGVPFDSFPTQRAGHAVELARDAVRAGRKLVIAAGGDGTVEEVAQALAGTDTALGIMPLGSVMNMARALCIPRDLDQAARVIAAGNVLAIDAGKVDDRYFLEAAGVGLDAGLFAYFNRLDKGPKDGTRIWRVLRGLFRFLRGLGAPRLEIDLDNGVAVHRLRVRAAQVTVANGPFVGAAYAVAPDAQIDDGLLDVVIFRGLGIPRLLLHYAAIAGGRRFAPPPEAGEMRVRRVDVRTVRRRPLPVHADGEAIGATPARFEVVPAALKVLVGAPEAGTTCTWICSSQDA
jgi:YegS/Rv2252/BmrU family lipid kinase